MNENEDPRDWSKPSRAVVACDGDGNGCLLFFVGAHIESLRDEVGSRLDDLGLDDAPLGLSIWEGVMRGGERYSTPDGTDYADTYLEGKFRELTAEEWKAVMFKYAPWDSTLWLRP